MEFVGRSQELGRLRSALDAPGASVLEVEGPAGVGKTRLVVRAAEASPTLYCRVPALPEPDQIGALGRAAAAGPASRGPDAAGDAGAEAGSWHDVFRRLLDVAPAGGTPLVLVLDDAHRLRGSRARFEDALAGTLREARRRSLGLHVVLTARTATRPFDGEDADLLSEELALGPLPFRAAALLLPGRDVRERIVAYSVLGGAPGRLALVDPEATLATNVRRLMLEPAAPLAEAPPAMLEREVQTPPRYAAVLRALAWGEADWSRVHEGVTDLTGSGQVAPYLKKLEELGHVEVRRSLDAGPRGRSRRYRIADPFLAFWFRFLLPHAGRLALGEGEALWGDAIKDGIEDHAASVFPEVCRQYMRHDAMELLGANGREVGSLWGPEYDMDVAGALFSGAVFYGLAHWGAVPDGARLMERLNRQIRETRWGFGRELRLRTVFSVRDFPRDLEREAARRHDAVLVGAAELAG